MDETLFLSFNIVSKVFFLIFRFSMCLCCSSDSMIFLAMCFLRVYVLCLIANFIDANVRIKHSRLHFIIKSMSSLILRCFAISSSKFHVIFNISCPYFFLITLKMLIRVYNIIVKKITRSPNIFGK